MRKLLLPLLLLLLCPMLAEGQIRQVSSAPFTGGTLKSVLLLPDGTAAAPAIAFSADTDLGFYRQGSNVLDIAMSNAARFRFGAATFSIFDDAALIRLGASSDVRLTRDAANILALRNDTNAQTFRIYNTYTDAANYERISLGWVANSFLMNDEYAGTGLARKFGWAFNGTVRWEVTATAFQPGTTASYDIGSDALRARSLYLSSGTYLSPQAAPSNPASGGVLYIDSADNDLKIKYSDGTVVVIGNKP